MTILFDDDLAREMFNLADAELVGPLGVGIGPGARSPIGTNHRGGT
jgi:hypothetical protein